MRTRDQKEAFVFDEKSKGIFPKDDQKGQIKVMDANGRLLKSSGFIKHPKGRDSNLSKQGIEALFIGHVTQILREKVRTSGCCEPVQAIEALLNCGRNVFGDQVVAGTKALKEEFEAIVLAAFGTPTFALGSEHGEVFRKVMFEGQITNINFVKFPSPESLFNFDFIDLGQTGSGPKDLIMKELCGVGGMLTTFLYQSGEGAHLSDLIVEQKKEVRRMVAELKTTIAVYKSSQYAAGQNQHSASLTDLFSSMLRAIRAIKSRGSSILEFQKELTTELVQKVGTLPEGAFQYLKLDFDKLIIDNWFEQNDRLVLDLFLKVESSSQQAWRGRPADEKVCLGEEDEEFAFDAAKEGHRRWFE